MVKERGYNMDGPCTGINAQFRDGGHRWEYFGTQQGEEWERCADCMEARLARYHDVGSGG
jgi:hypothetical protein